VCDPQGLFSFLGEGGGSGKEVSSKGGREERGRRGNVWLGIFSARNKLPLGYRELVKESLKGERKERKEMSSEMAECEQVLQSEVVLAQSQNKKKGRKENRDGRGLNQKHVVLEEVRHKKKTGLILALLPLGRDCC